MLHHLHSYGRSFTWLAINFAQVLMLGYQRLGSKQSIDDLTQNCLLHFQKAGIYMKHCRAPRNHGNYLPQPDPVATSIVPILIPSSKMSSSSIPIRDRSQPSSDRRPSSRASSHQAPPSREGSRPPPTSRQSSRPWPTSRSSSRPATTAPASSDQPSSGQAAPAVRRALDDVLPAELLGSVASFLERVCTQAGHLSFH